MVASTHLNRLIRFLTEDLSLSTASMNMALKQIESNPGPLPMVLWQYGLVTIEQLNQIYDWLDLDKAS
jgi:Protein of unknown function (DUF2949)